MQLLAHFATAVALIISVANAAPTPAPESPESLGLLNLIVQVKSGQDGHDFNGSYLEPFHTGAVSNDIVLSKAVPTEGQMFLNEIQLQWNYAGGESPPYGTNFAFTGETGESITISYLKH